MVQKNILLLAATFVFCVIISGSVPKLSKPLLPEPTSSNPAKLNPLLPGYFADPTIKKFGDTYYIYATTDNVMFASGAPTVWISKDFVNWYNYIMDVPSFTEIPLTNFWAPDIVEHEGQYYLYFGNCEMGCNIYGYQSATPIGPWKKLSEKDKPIIAHNFPRKGFPSLDAQFFTDTDGKIYGYWGTWVHYNGGYAAGELNSKDLMSMTNAVNIPLAQTPSPFEAVYMMKRGSKYILMYSGGSCHDATYHVRYSYADSPYGPFTPGANNPILASNAEGTVHGPGHHSVLEENGKAYIVYHKHDYPMTRGGLSRQTAIDELEFENDSTIKAVIPKNTGSINPSGKKAPTNLALGAKATSSSHYRLQEAGGTYEYAPNFVTDDNNGTLWKAGTNILPQDLTIDLGTAKQVKRVFTQFEFATYYYQYILRYSMDGKNWKVFADRSKNLTPGSPMIDENDVKARYLKLTVTNTEKQGLLAAVWNMKVYDHLFEIPTSMVNKSAMVKPAVNSKREKILELNLAGLATDQPLTSLANKGTLGGIFKREGKVSIKMENGVKCLDFENGALVSDQAVPQTLAWNGSYTISAWVKNPEVGKDGECLLSWCDRRAVGLANSYQAFHYNSAGFGAAAHLDGHFDMKYSKLPKANEWHLLVLTFDGVVEKVYVDGVLDNAQNMTLSSMVKNAKFRIGTSDIGENYTGLMASLKMYDYALTAAEIQKEMANSPVPSVARKDL
jgi:xylan 1,4-beta-xylosidase